MIFDYDSQGNLKINIFDILDNTDDDAKLEFIESLSCRESVIKHVVDQILNGQTENGFCGFKSLTESYPRDQIDKARREISKRSSEIAKEEIKRLEEALRKSQENVKEMDDKYWDLYHSRNQRK